MSAPTPVLIPEPFANDAGPSFINVIPATTADPQRAAYDEGFPPQTFQPEASGGKPPLGQDFNGILNAITQHLFALQGGALQAYRADVSTALGGYNKGALVAMANGEGYWISIAANNTTDPDAGGAGWHPVYAYGSGAALAVTGGVLTLDAVQASRPFIVVTGTLSGNQQIVFPNSYQHWLVINLCVMGGFTLTVKTAAGVGIPVPAGGAASPTAIYCDTVDVYRVFTPAALPTSVPAIPDSILLRDNTGAAFGLTATLGDATLKLATTEFVNRASSLAGNGFMVHPNGLIEQWGSLTKRASLQGAPVSFPMTFPNALYNLQVSWTGGISFLSSAWAQVIGVSNLAGFAVNSDDYGTGSPDPIVTVYWRALGR